MTASNISTNLYISLPGTPARLATTDDVTDAGTLMLGESGRGRALHTISIVPMCRMPGCTIAAGHEPALLCGQHVGGVPWRLTAELRDAHFEQDHERYIVARTAIVDYLERQHGRGRPAMLRERAESVAVIREQVSAACLTCESIAAASPLTPDDWPLFPPPPEHVAEVLAGDWPCDGSNCLPTSVADALHRCGVTIPAMLLADRPELVALTIPVHGGYRP